MLRPTSFLWGLSVSCTLAAADIDLTARYILTNLLLSSSQSLSSTLFNDTLLVTSGTSESSQTWYLSGTSTPSHYRLHTAQKGEQYALDVDNYNGKNAIDMHFYAVQDRTGQYWSFNKQGDGTFKISNNYTGSSIFLDLDEDTLKPTLRAGDGEGTKWTMSALGESPTPTVTAGVTKLATPSMSATASSSASESDTNATTADEQSACTASCSATSTGTAEKSKISTSAITGIAVGGVAVLGALIGGLVFWYCRWRNRRTQLPTTRPAPMKSDPMLNVT